MRAWFLILCAPLATFAQNDFLSLGENDYFACSDTFSIFDTAILGKVARNLGMERIPNYWGGTGLGFKNDNLGWLFSYAEYKIPRVEIDLRLSPLSYKCIFEDSIILCRFKVEVPPLTTTSSSVFKFLLSAYRQERSPEIAEDERKFVRLTPKTSAALIRRIWISPLLGMRYLHDDDPFSSFHHRSVVIYGLVDLAGWACIIGSPFVPAKKRSRLLGVAAGVTALAGARITIGGELLRDLRRYNTIHDSHYRVPAEIFRLTAKTR